jgi:hypothetical protein
MSEHPTPQNDATGSISEQATVTNRNVVAQSQPEQNLQDIKLALEIAELRRSPWLKPSVVVPIIAALLTLGLSQYLGVFDVERKRNENATKEAELRRTMATQELARLAIEKQELVAEKEGLATLKAGLGRDVATLQRRVLELNGEATTLRSRTKTTEVALANAERKLKHTTRVLARPVVNLSRTVLPSQELADLYMINRGQGTAYIRVLKTFVDDVLMEEGQLASDRYGPTLDALGINYEWLRWHWPETGLPKDKQVSLFAIEARHFSKERADLFAAAMDRLGVEICYCSEFGDCYWAAFNRAARPAGSCTPSNNAG